MVKNINVHFIGIGGSGASAAASIAYFYGYNVTGCDLKEDSQYTSHLKKIIDLKIGHSDSHISKSINLAVVSPAVLKLDPNNLELASARLLKIPIITWQKFMGDYLQKGKKVIAVTGSHGKSTTTAMIGHILEKSGLDPTVEIGAIDIEWQSNFRVGRGEYFVCEADEYNNNFLNYKPNYIAITNIEMDHPDFFESESKLFSSFLSFVESIQKPGLIFVKKPSFGISKLLKSFKKDSKLQIIASPKINIRLNIFGDHNIDNALLAFAVCKKLGISEKLIKDTLAHFRGVSQRLEKRGTFFKAALFSDYAVHPTEIKTVLKTLEAQYPKSKLFVVFEPHTYSRFNYFFNDFVKIFSKEDIELIITDIFAAREKEAKFKPQDLASKVKNALYLTPEEIPKFLQNEVRKQDLIVVLGAGNSYKIVDSLLKLASSE